MNDPDVSEHAEGPRRDGMFCFWPVVRPLCSRYNGAPFRVGDRVRILAGPRKGAVAEVYETPVGQGGWKLVRLDLGPERRATYGDLFEQYSVLRMPEPHGP